MDNKTQIYELTRLQKKLDDSINKDKIDSIIPNYKNGRLPANSVLGKTKVAVYTTVANEELHDRELINHLHHKLRGEADRLKLTPLYPKLNDDSNEYLLNEYHCFLRIGEQGDDFINGTKTIALEFYIDDKIANP